MHIAFDFDGTICDSLPVYLEIARKYCLENNLKPIPLSEARLIGLKGIISHYHLSPLQIAKILLWSRAQLSSSYSSLPLVKDIVPVLEKLSVKNSLGLITSTHIDQVNINLKKHHLEHLFTYIEGGVDLFGKSHKLKKHPVDYYVGDETRDMEAAAVAGCKSVAVTWGFEDEKLLTASHPDQIANKPADLLKLLI